MKNNRRLVLAASAVAALALVSGCATSIKASSTDNPPPAQAFSSYGRIEVKPVVFQQGYQGDHSALTKIDENMKKNLAPQLEQWNHGAGNGRTLTVEPVVEELSFKSATKRVFLGPLAGSSGVLMRVTFRDNTGKVIATPQFFQRAGAWNGAFTMGIQDNLMLTRVASLASNYIIANYDKAVGGPTGADDKAVAQQ